MISHGGSFGYLVSFFIAKDVRVTFDFVQSYGATARANGVSNMCEESRMLVVH
jgi:hypothetical protein